MKSVLILFFSLITMGWVIAQNKKGEVKPVKKGPKAKYPFRSSPVYLGHSKVTGGNISKPLFDSLVNQGLYAIDSAGVAGQVIQFRLYYKQRNLYEDSVGNFYTDMDLLSDLSKSNKLNPYVDMSRRSKKGDTAYFDDIMVMLPDSIFVAGNMMKFAITK